MKLLPILWRLVTRRRDEPPEHSRFVEPSAEGLPSRMPADHSPASMRRDLLRLVLRTTLARNGIPTDWIGVEALTATSRGSEPRLHVRFAIRHWNPRIPLYAPALQDDFHRRLVTFDPLASTWMRGYSWRFDLPPRADYPDLPHPGSWIASAPVSAGSKPPGPQAIADPIIAGPVVIGGSRQRPLGTSRPGTEDAWAPEDGFGRQQGADSAATEPAPLSRELR